MENMGEWEQRSLMNELTQGRELARQLQLYLNMPSSSSSHETPELLVQKIQASYEKALSMLNSNVTSSAAEPQPSGLAIRMSESPPSRSASPRSEDSDRDMLKEQELKDTPKKRKTQPRWTQQVQVTPGTALEGPLDDGFSWRKYGQKDILGAKYPRGYYRCTHRNVQGCLATKQVQRSDDDPTIFEITYRGRHTCTVASHVMHPTGSSETQEQGTCIEPQQLNQLQPEHNQKQSQDLLLSYQKGLKVITDDLDFHEQTYPSFPYPSSTSNIKVENNIAFSSPSVINNSVVGNLSPSFMSPATSGTNYFSTSQSPRGINSTHVQANINSFQTSEPQLTQIMQAATSATNSPTIGLDFPFGNGEFDPNFTFDNHGFF
ncbi:hypothetical protein DITRI_Ditri04bG0167200 [Diplodiscus trichospermus]